MKKIDILLLLAILMACFTDFFASASASTECDDLLYGKGQFRTLVVPLELKKEEVQRLLPQGLIVRPESPLSEHVLVWLHISRQYHVHPVIGCHDFPKPFGKYYSEILLMIPGVYDQKATGKKNQYAGPFVHMPILYLDNLRAILAGKIYGYPKRYGRITSGNDGYELHDQETGDFLLHALFVVYGQLQSLNSFPKLEQDLKKILTLPFISVRSGKFSCSRFSWDFSHAQVAPVFSAVLIENNFLEGLNPFNRVVNRLTNDNLGSFFMKVDWNLYWPFDCRQL